MNSSAKKMPLVLGVSGVSGGKEFCKLLVTMTMARLDPKRENTLPGQK